MPGSDDLHRAGVVALRSDRVYGPLPRGAKSSGAGQSADPGGAELSTRSWDGPPEAETRWNAQLLLPRANVVGVVRIIGHHGMVTCGEYPTCDWSQMGPGPRPSRRRGVRENADAVIGASPTTGSVEGIVTEPPASEKKAKTTGRLAISPMTLSAKLRFRTRRVLASDQPLRVTRPPRAGSEKLSCPVST